jgi:hypothetical protein
MAFRRFRGRRGSFRRRYRFPRMFRRGRRRRGYRSARVRIGYRM